MALSDKRIIEAREAGDIVIEPFRREHLSTSSYDLSLGEWYFREQKRRPGQDLYNIWDKAHTDRVWGTAPHRAEKAKTALADFGSQWVGIDADDKVILIGPGETILAHTEEYIGGRNHITTMMKARSSMGRNFIEVCKCAGWGDVGYVNRWTMEISNNSTQYVIPLVVGRRVAQLVFFETGEILDRGYAHAGKYQTHNDIKRMKKEWRPEQMLPKLYKDREIKR